MTKYLGAKQEPTHFQKQNIQLNISKMPNLLHKKVQTKEFPTESPVAM